MATFIGSGVAIRLSMNSSQFSSGITKASADMGRLGRTTTTVLGGMKAAFAGLQAFLGPIVGIFAAVRSVSMFTEAEKQATRLKSVLAATGGAAGNTFEQLQEFARLRQNKTVFDDDAILGSMATLATKTSVTGDTFKRTIVDAQDLATVMQTDLNGAVMMLGKALQDPTRGMMALRRAGVSFSKDQQDVIKSLHESGKMLEAQDMILKQVESTMGGAAEAQANTFGGMIQQFRNTFGNLMESIGGGIAKTVGPILQFARPLIDFVSSLVDVWGEWNGALTQSAIAIAKGIGGTLLEWFRPITTWIEDIKGSMPSLRDSITNVAERVGIAFGVVIDVIGTLGETIDKKLLAPMRRVADLANVISGNFAGGFVRGLFGGTLAGAGIGEVSADLDGLGATATRIRDEFAKLRAAGKGPPTKAKQPGQPPPQMKALEFKLPEAIIRGSKEDVGLRNQFRAGVLDQKQVLLNIAGELEEMNETMDEVARNTRPIPESPDVIVTV